MWLVNKLHEEEDGQDILLTYSKDFLHWTKPVKFPVDDKYRTEGLIHPGGFLVNGDELNLYFSYYEWTDNTVTGPERKDFSHKNTKMFCITTKDLVNFSEPIDMNLDMQMVLPPQRTSTGKLIGGGMFTFPWTDDPNGIHGFKKAGYLPEEVYANYPDHSQSFYEVGKYAGLEVHLMEASLMDYGDGHLKMLLRSRDNRNFVQLENELIDLRDIGVTAAGQRFPLIGHFRKQLGLLPQFLHRVRHILLNAVIAVGIRIGAQKGQEIPADLVESLQALRRLHQNIRH
jgi:hypothetical protein